MPNLNLNRALAKLPQSRLTYYRKPAGAWVRGFWRSSGVNEAVPFKAHSQPSRPSELRHLPGGEEISDARTIYTRTALRVTDDVAGTEADLVVDSDGVVRKVISDAPWIESGRFHVFICGRVREEVPA